MGKTLLDDRQVKRVLAERAEGATCRQLANKYGVSETTIRNVIKRADGEVAELCAQKKAQNTMDMLRYMDSRRDMAQGIIDDYLRALADPRRLESAGIREIATALGIVIDKFTKNAPPGSAGNQDAFEKLYKAIGDGDDR